MTLKFIKIGGMFDFLLNNKGLNMFCEIEILDLKPIPGTVGYLASRDGRIFKDDYFCTELKQYKNGNGYYCTSIRTKMITDPKLVNPRALVHRLIAITFVDGYKEGLVVDHIDCNKTNNHASNLRWVTSSFNSRRRGPCIYSTSSRYSVSSFYARNIESSAIRRSSTISEFEEFLGGFRHTVSPSKLTIFHNKHGMLINGKWEVSTDPKRWDYQYVTEPRVPGFCIIRVFNKHTGDIVDTLFNKVEFYRKYKLWNHYIPNKTANETLLIKLREMYPDLDAEITESKKEFDFQPRNVKAVTKKKTIVMLSTTNGDKKYFGSLRDVERSVGICRKHLSSLLNTNRLYKKQFKFYIE